jgi:hypothetical protein
LTESSPTLAKILERYSITLSRHCEERSDDAIHKIVGQRRWHGLLPPGPRAQTRGLTCGSLAMTVASRFDRKPL